MREDHGTLLNLTVRFGDKVLMDLYDEVVLPAFTDSRPRIHGKSKYVFLNAREEIVNIGTESAKPISKKMVVGQFVKDTILESTQVLDGKQLVRSEQSVRSSPSATFGLILDGHTMVYISDTPSAPAYSAFATTLKKKLSLAWEDFIDRVYDMQMERYRDAGGAKSDFKRPTKKALRSIYGKPTVELIPYPRSGSVRAALQRLDKITSVRIRVFPTNQQAQARKMLEGMEAEGEALGAAPVAVFRNETGLSKTPAINLTTEVSEKANADYEVVGETEEGKDKITPHDVKLEVKHLSRQPTVVGNVRSFIEQLIRRNLLPKPQSDE